MPNGRVDNLSYRLRFSDDCIIGEWDKETVLDHLDGGWSFDSSNGEYVFDKEKFHVRLTGERAIIYLRREFKGLDITALKSDGIEEIFDIKEWLEKECNLKFEDKSVIMGKMNTQDVAIENHPIVRLVIDHSPLEPHNVDPVKDSEGRIRLYLDHSGEGDLEGSNAGYPSGYGKFNEDDIDYLMDELRHKIENKRGWALMRKFSEFLESEGSGVFDVVESNNGFNQCENNGFSVDKQGVKSKREKVDLSMTDMEKSTSEKEDESSKREKEFGLSDSLENLGVESSKIEDFESLLDCEFKEKRSGAVFEIFFLPCEMSKDVTLQKKGNKEVLKDIELSSFLEKLKSDDIEVIS